LAYSGELCGNKQHLRVRSSSSRERVGIDVISYARHIHRNVYLFYLGTGLDRSRRRRCAVPDVFSHGGRLTGDPQYDLVCRMVERLNDLQINNVLYAIGDGGRDTNKGDVSTVEA